MIMNKNILWLASWYPNVLSPYDGDFIQRHAKAVALFQKLTVIYIKKDVDGIITKNEKIVISTHDNLTEIIIYYHSLKTGINFLDRLISLKKYLKVYQRILLTYINKHGKPDLVHVHVPLNAGILALWLKKKYNIPFIISEHWGGYFREDKFGLNSLNAVQKRLIKKIFEHALILTVVSEVLGKSINDFYGKLNYIIIPNTIDTSIFYPIEAPENKIVQFIHISTLGCQKNPEQIIEGFEILKNEGYSFQLIIYGPKKIGLEALVKRISLNDSVQFKNEVPQSKLAEDLRKADALILYSRYETFGCVVIEANACGVPAILSDLPVFKEYINENVNGIFAKPNTPFILANKLKEFILHKSLFDKNLIANITATRFSYEAIGGKFIDLYENIIPGTE